MKTITIEPLGPAVVSIDQPSMGTWNHHFQYENEGKSVIEVVEKYLTEINDTISVRFAFSNHLTINRVDYHIAALIRVSPNPTVTYVNWHADPYFTPAAEAKFQAPDNVADLARDLLPELKAIARSELLKQLHDRLDAVSSNIKAIREKYPCS